jgi:phenol 2-monooxygenase
MIRSDVNRYQIGQRIAKNFSSDRIFLCGDAAHTHSSGAAQGLNTGIHDAVNLGWKLALHIRGITKGSVLDTYDSERKRSVQQLIDYDKDISTLMSHKWPSWYKGDPNADPYLVLGEIFERAASFNTGLAISYPMNDINQNSTLETTVIPGSRPPYVELTMPGTRQKLGLQRVTRNLAKFWVIVFAGNPVLTHTSLAEFEKTLVNAKDLSSSEAVGWLTISVAAGNSPYETLGMKPFGDTFYDPTSSAHERFGFNPDEGGILVLRPDGLVGATGPLGEWVKDYFRAILQ